MGKFDDLLEEFIESIPSSKLTGFSESKHLVWGTTEFRLDMQGVRRNQSIEHRLNPTGLNGSCWQMTSDGKFNLQIQANKGAKATTIARAAPNTVAGPVFIGRDEEVSAEEVRRMLLAKRL